MMFEIGGILYDKEASLQLRDKLIEQRDRCVGPDKFDGELSIILTHTIAWMSNALIRLWPEGVE